MKDWNVVVSVREGHFSQAWAVFGEYGRVGKTDFHNVLVIQVENVAEMLDAVKRRMSADLDGLSWISRLVPVTRTFSFQSPEQFEAEAREAVLALVPRLAGRSFHVRMHRRGFKGRLSSVEEERFLDDVILETLEKSGIPGRVSFEDPDAIVVIETVGPQAGLSVWEREDISKYPFLRLD